jgi:hypothetical protein
MSSMLGERILDQSMTSAGQNKSLFGQTASTVKGFWDKAIRVFKEGCALVRQKFQAPSIKFQTNSKFQIPMTQTKALNRTAATTGK